MIDDEALTYYGRWQTVGNSKIANWNAPYVKFNFTGTSLLADIEGSANIYVTIDGIKNIYSGVTGRTNLATGLEDTEHTAMIQFRSINGKTGLKGLYIDENATATAYVPDVPHIQFIGDSITTYGTSYSYSIPEKYGLDYSIISMSGIALQDNVGWYYGTVGITPTEQVGMESAYFCQKCPRDAYSTVDGDVVYNNSTADWLNDNPDVIVIGIGTNDNDDINKGTIGATQEDFKNSYIEFVEKLAEEFTNADIYILRQFNHTYGDYDKLRKATYDAYDELSKTYSNVKYIDSTDWDIEISNDKVHPTTAGFNELSKKVYEAISGSLN